MYFKWREQYKQQAAVHRAKEAEKKFKELKSLGQGPQKKNYAKDGRSVEVLQKSSAMFWAAHVYGHMCTCVY